MLFYSYQFGFIKNNSTNYALIEIAEYEMLVTKNLFTCGVYVDLQKALDTVNHEMFLSKLCIIFKNSISQCTTRVYLDMSHLSTSTACTIQVNIVMYITMKMNSSIIEIFWIKVLNIYWFLKDLVATSSKWRYKKNILLSSFVAIIILYPFQFDFIHFQISSDLLSPN